MNSYNEMLKGLLDDVRPEHSFLNYHARGMHYLCLRRDLALTVKLYIISDGELSLRGETFEPQDPGTGFLVNPHTHRYSFTQMVLCGSMHNVVLEKLQPEFTTIGRLWNKWKYVSPLAPDAKSELTPVGSERLRPHYHWMLAGDAYHMAPGTIHTLKVNLDNGPLVLLSYQHADLPLPSTDLYVRGPTADLNLDGMYLKPTQDEVDRLIQYLRRIDA